MREFGNAVPSNPNRCLTFHGFKRKNDARENNLELDKIEMIRLDKIIPEEGELVRLEQDHRGR